LAVLLFFFIRLTYVIKLVSQWTRHTHRNRNIPLTTQKLLYRHEISHMYSAVSFDKLYWKWNKSKNRLSNWYTYWKKHNRHV